MVENTNHCVLKWSGHAGYVTERFSELLASQALVDITLMCEDQKLRVHKLVLASNSTYFEKILQEDLGQEPIILLRDLSFKVLKAMVEFMYCGGTTISHENLPSLLTASRIFKVKELTCIIDTVMKTKNYNSTNESVTLLHKSDNELYVKNNNLEKYCCVNAKNDLTSTKYNFDNTFKHTLYEDSYDNESTNVQQNNSTNTLLTEDCKEETQDKLCAILIRNKEGIENCMKMSNKKKNDEILDICKNEVESSLKENLLMKDHKENIQDESYNKSIYEKERLNNYIKMNNVKINDETLDKSKEIKPLLYEQCCDVLDLTVSKKYSTTLPQCVQDIKLDATQNVIDNTPDKIGKCIKVYTHKKRKPVINTKNELTHLNNLISKLSSTNSIDLSDMQSSNSIPVTLLTPLDMECAEYHFGLDNEYMQSVAEGMINEQRSLMKCKDFNENTNIFSIHKNNVNKKDFNFRVINDKVQKIEKPVLRRSVRLNQQESEDLTNNAISLKKSIVTKKLLDKTNIPSKMESFSTRKRKIKKNSRKAMDQNVNNITRYNKKCFNKLHSTKNSSKTQIKKTINKSDQKSKASNKVKCEMTTNNNDIDKMNISMELPSHFQQNNVGRINRALWGDMSDIIEHSSDIMDLADYRPNGEIPFAVGLLPLRTALERMQATPDYQPRKTRSFFAPVKQEINNPHHHYHYHHHKRKNSSLESNVLGKKQNLKSIVQDNKTKTVCHIQIRAAPPQYIKRKKLFAEHVTSLGSAATFVNRQ
ncbi:hypothetical protein M0804_004570 [Polistes exclamans]|nr:hypothetical protein M0804_004570 [Polistes exclamans]